MRTVIYPYKMGSASAKALAQALDARRVRPVGRYKPRREDLIVNWGASTIPRWYEAYMRLNGEGGFLNYPNCVRNATNKLSCFRILTEASVPTVEWTTEPHVVLEWQRDNRKIVARGTLTGHSGAGIEIVDIDDWIPRAPLYTKYINPVAEYRVHVFDGKVIDYVKKRRRNGDQPEGIESMVRSLGNGWVFTRENLRRLERVEEMAVNAIKALGLDFGAVDILRDEDNNCMVLEVNTAMGMQGTTLEAYKQAILNYARV